MLPSTGYFKDINCPFYDSGLCERPYCHFRHSKKDNSESNGDVFENGEILQQLVSEAVKKVLQNKDGAQLENEAGISPQALISKVVQELKPSVPLQTVQYSPTVTKATYNPTPISQLKKLIPESEDLASSTSSLKELSSRKHIPVPYTPYRPSRSQINRPITSSSTLKPYSASTTAAVPDPYSPVPSADNAKSKNVQAATYTPTEISSIKDVKTTNCYTPTGEGASGATYNPGTAPPGGYSLPGYCPTGGESPCYSTAFSYQPTPLLKTKYPQFSSDEDEPTSKKSKLNDLDDLDQEFEILGQIIDDENKEKAPLDADKCKEAKTSSSSSGNAVKDNKKVVEKCKSSKSDSKSKDASRSKHESRSKTSHSKGESSAVKKSQSSSERDDKKTSKSSSSKNSSSKTSSSSTKHSSGKESKSEKDNKTKESSKSSSSRSNHSDSKHRSSHKSSHSEKSKSHSDKSEKSKGRSKSHSRRKSSESKKRKEEKEEARKVEEQDLIHDSDIEILSDSDEDRIAEECLRIFEDYVPTVKEASVPQISKHDNSEADEASAGKKRVAHETSKTIYRSVTKAPPNHKLKAVQLLSERYAKVKEFHQAKVQSTSVESPVTSSIREESPSSTSSSRTNSSKLRIAHVPNVSTILNAKKAIPKPVEVPKASTVSQTVSKGTSRVAHMPNDVFSERPGVLEPLASKIPVNIRSRYLNMMIDECLKIYLTAEDAYSRAQQEELTTHKKCTAAAIYKNSAILTITRLRKELQDSNGVKKSSNQNTISHDRVLVGKKGETISWSIENKYKKNVFSSTEFTGQKFYENILKWVMSEDELKENGFPRPHPEKTEKGCAKIFTKNTRQKPQKGFLRTCCRCKREYTVDKRGKVVKQEECIYHPNNKYRYRGEVKYQCCGQDGSSDGCLSASSHVYEYIDHDNLRGYVTTLPRDDDSITDHGVFALDCEMCYTTNGLDLTRVTVIDPSCKVVYESLVRPFYPIIDYNTRYSGLTEEDLCDVTTTLVEVQATFLHMFSNKTILVGHSLESDFKALKLIHDTVVDTSVLFPHKMGPPYKRALRNLSSEYLKKIIQNSVDGHDSAEDATVCMELLIWKLKEELKLR